MYTLGDLKDRLTGLAEGLVGFYEDGPGDFLKWKASLRLTLQVVEYRVLLELLEERYVERAANLRSKIEDLEERTLALDQTIGREVQVTGVGDVPCRHDPRTGKSYLQMQAELGEEVNVLAGILRAWAEDVDKPGNAERWYSARWYHKATKEGLYPDLLGRAYRDKRITGRKAGKRNQYELGSVCEAYPDYRGQLERAAVDPEGERQRTDTNQGDRIAK